MILSSNGSEIFSTQLEEIEHFVLMTISFQPSTLVPDVPDLLVTVLLSSTFSTPGHRDLC